MTAVLEIIEVIAKMIEGGFGIRYIISSRYRKKVNERLKGKSKFTILHFAFETFIGIAVLGVILFVIFSSISDGT